MINAFLKPKHLFCLLALATVIALPSAAAPDLDAPDFKKLKADYERIYSAYPEKRKSFLDKMLGDYLDSSRSRYESEKAASNLKGMGVAKIAVEKLEQARAELIEKGDFEIPENVHSALQEFFAEVEKSRDELLKNIEERKERLRRRTFIRFADLYRKADPSASDESIIAEFEDWIAPSESVEKKEDTEKKEAEKDLPRISASELGLNLFSKEYSELKKAFSTNISRLDQLRRKALDKLLGQEIEKAEDWYSEQKRVRNIKGMAIAGKAVSLLEQTRDHLAEKGELQLPDKEEQREEIQEFLDEFRARMQAGMKPYTDKGSFIRDEGLKRFKQIAEQQVPGIDPASLETIYQDWLADKYKQVQPTEVATTGGGSNAGSQAGPSTADRLFFAQTGSSDDWFTVGSWRGESKSMDIFSIPIYAGRDRRGTQMNIQTGLPSTWTYKHEKELDELKFYAFRLKKIKGDKPVDVVAWPSQRNDWALEVRTGRQAGEYGFEIQAGRTVGPGGLSQARERFDIAVVTRPAGARVYVDGERKYQPGTESLTPMKIRLESGSYDIKLDKEDCLPKLIEGFRAGPGARIEAELKHESDLPGQRMAFSSAKTWKRTKIKVETGDKIWVVAEGEWTAGSKGEAVGPAGYSRAEYPHYYSGADLRKFKEANYGALLMKVGEEYYGAPAEVENKRAIAVNDRVGVTANTWGELWFDVNETEDGDERRNNRGALKLKVVVMPGGKVPQN